MKKKALLGRLVRIFFVLLEKCEMYTKFQIDTICIEHRSVKNKFPILFTSEQN